MRKLTLPLLLIALLYPCSGNAFPGNWTQKNDVAFNQINGPGQRGGALCFTVGTLGYVGGGFNGSVSLNDLWSYDASANAWTQRASLPGPTRQRGMGFAISGKGYFCGGIDNIGNAFLKDTWEYDPGSNTWTQRADFGGGPRYDAVAFTIGSKGYIGTGFNGVGNSFKDLWAFDPGSNTWVQKTDFGGDKRFAACGFSIGTDGYICAGQDSVTFRQDLWRYNSLTDTWSQMTDLAGTPRYFAGGFSTGGKGYVCMGFNFSGALSDLWAYDPGTDSWTGKAAFPGGARYAYSSFAVGGNAYAGMGQYNNDLWRYDPIGDAWTIKAGLGGVDRFGAVGFSIGTKGYIGCGLSNGGSLKDLWEFDPSLGSWSQKADLPGPDRFHAFSFTIGNKGYVGTGYPSYFADMYAYDPTFNTWTPKANFGGGGRGTAIGFSAGGKGYAGLGTSFSGYKKDLWEYDPTADTWTQMTDFPGGPRWCPLGIAIGNKGYVGLGTDTTSVYYSDIWEFDPSANAWAAKPNYPGAGSFLATGFSIGGIGYIGTGGVPLSSDFWALDPVANTWTQQASVPGATRYGAVSFAIGTKGYLGTGFLHDFYEFDPTSCITNQVTLTLNTDGNAAQTSWDIVVGNTNTVICSGSGYANNSVIPVNCCLANGCYDLRVYDSFGDGINPGGYVLRDAANNRIIDNSNNGPNFSSLSEVLDVSNTPVSFCVPLGTDALVPSSCDQTGLTINSVIQAQINANVTAQYGITNATSGYQFWIFSPNTGYSRRLFLSHAAPGTGWPPLTPVAQRAAYLKLSAMSSVPTIPSNVMLNVRVRSRVANVYGEFGPACRLTIGTVTNCSTTQLTTTPTPLISCGATLLNRLTGVLWSNNVLLANKYQFEFVNANTLVFLRNISSPTRNLNMNTWGNAVALPTCFIPYNIRVRVSFNNGATWCPWGPVCQVTFTCPPENGRALQVVAARDALHVWPNPNNGEQLFISISDLGEEISTASIDVIDVFGKRVMSENVPVDGSELNTVLDLKHALSDGLYVVNITATDKSGQAGEQVFTQRLVIAR